MVARIKIDTNEAGGGLAKKADEGQEEAGRQGAEAFGKTHRGEDPLTKLHEAEKRAAENYDKYVRAVADLDNYRKRAAREKADAIQYGNENLLRDMLPLVDNVDRALEHAGTSDDFEAFKKGLKMLHEQLLCCLRKYGVEVIDTAGKDFDPHVHEAMLQVVSDEHEGGKVVNEFERGYLLNGRLLRPAKVCVCKRPEAGSDPDKNRGDRTAS